MRTIALLISATVLLAGCGSSEPVDPAPRTTTESGATASPSATATPRPEGAVVRIEIKDGKVTPQGDRVEVEVGDKVTLEITSDADEELHVHSEPEHTYEISAGESTVESFTPKTPGQVAVEAHELGVTIVQLVVRP